jgi:hypothetical protein
MKVKWYQRFQVEIGGRWQLFPSSDITWKQWLFDPFFNLVWPGKIINPRADLPDGSLFGGFEIAANNEYKSLVYWLGTGIRVLGLDLGIGIFIRSKQSIAKLEGQK